MRIFLTAQEVATVLGCAPSTVLKYVSEGKLPGPAKIGRLTRWRRDTLLAFLEARWGVASDAADKIDLLKLHAPQPIYWAAMFALYTGQRRGDVLRMMWSDIDQGLILVRQGKTGKRLWIPIHSQLREILTDIPRNSTHILTSAIGRPWKGFGFSTAWQRTLGRKELMAIREAGLVFRGLRKSAAVKLAEAGCTDAEIAAITGQTRQMVEHYTKGVDQKRLAVAAMRKWEARAATE